MLKTTRKTYGTTWWGKAWLAPLEAQSEAARLTRGKTYVNTGKVTQLKWGPGQVEARVQGSYGAAYKVRLALPVWQPEQVAALEALIANHPAMAMELGMGHLPQQLFDSMMPLDMAIVPTRWEEMDTQCACQDEESPCKHLSAMVYALAHEIDKDPFVLFQLRGVALADLLTGQTTALVPAPPHPQPWSEAHFLPAKDWVRARQSVLIGPPLAMEELTYQFPAYPMDSLLSLLPDQPAFFSQGDFKAFLLKVYPTVAQGLAAVLPPVSETHLLGQDSFQIRIEPDSHNKDRLRVCGLIIPAKPQGGGGGGGSTSVNQTCERIASGLFEHHQTAVATATSASGKTTRRQPLLPLGKKARDPRTFTVALDSAMRCQLAATDAGLDSAVTPAVSQVLAFAPKAVGDWLDYFLTTPLPKPTDDVSESYRFFSVLASVAVGLVQANRYTPALVHQEQSGFTIAYRPLATTQGEHPALAHTLAILQQTLPPDGCVNSMRRCLAPQAVNELLALFITHLVHKVLGPQASETPNNHKLFNVFMRGDSFTATLFSDQSIARSLEQWLDTLYLSRHTIAPVLRLEAGKKDTFELWVDVINRDNSQDDLVAFADMMNDGPGAVPMVFGRSRAEVATEVSRQLMVASRYLPELKTLINSRGLERPVFELSQLSTLLLHTAGLLNLLGIDLILPKALKKLAFPSLQLNGKLRKPYEAGVSYLHMDELLEFSYDIAIGDQTLTVDEFKALVTTTEGLVQYRDQYLLLKPDEVARILKKLQDPLPTVQSNMQALYTLITGELDGVTFNATEAMARVKADLEHPEPLTLPAGLQATLRPYQEKGFHWLATTLAKGFGCCLADDMGLGKTVQVLALLLHLKETAAAKAAAVPAIEPPTKPARTKLTATAATAASWHERPPSLVICPTTLIGNWQKECQKFVPGLDVVIYHGTERSLKVQHADVVITSYGTFRRDLKKFQGKPWHCLILDEAQNIKNSETAQTQAIKSLKATHYIAMTGTPVENRLTELWNIFDFINPGYLGGMKHFKAELATPIEKYRNAHALEVLKKATAPFILRRLKTDKSIISDLPDKLILDEYCGLTTEQAAIYQNVVNSIMQQINSSSGIERKGLVFKLITALKQVCNHPAHYANKGHTHSRQSGKASKTMGLLESALDLGEKVLVFTQYTEMGKLLADMIQDELKEEALFFHGSLTRGQRDEMVTRFQTDRRCKIMILSLKAGGTGLNLTAASQVIHYDLWWNPAVENQATDRAFRIGQQNNVSVHRMITMGTFEEKIDEMIRAKKELADLTISTAEKYITELSNTELREIFSLSSESTVLAL
jgi:uncharacterized Zn finger protein/superfamily II DNA or RNA helicase